MTCLVQGAGREELAGKSPRDGGAATGAADWSVFQTKSKSVDEQVNIIITISSAVNNKSEICMRKNYRAICYTT
jgi:hypothetical protein